MRLEFATPAWLAMVGDLVADLVRQEGVDDGESITFSEVYRHVPREIAGHDGPVGWRVVVEGGRVAFKPEPEPMADIVIEVDYSFARETLDEHDATDALARRKAKAAIAAASAAGRFHVRGDLRRSPAVLSGLHDAVAARTIQGLSGQGR